MKREISIDAHMQFLKTISNAGNEKLILLQDTTKVDFESDDSEAAMFLAPLFKGAKSSQQKAFVWMLKAIIMQKRFYFAFARDTAAASIRKEESFPEEKRSIDNNKILPMVEAAKNGGYIEEVAIDGAGRAKAYKVVHPDLLQLITKEHAAELVKTIMEEQQMETVAFIKNGPMLSKRPGSNDPNSAGNAAASPAADAADAAAAKPAEEEEEGEVRSTSSSSSLPACWKVASKASIELFEDDELLAFAEVIKPQGNFREYYDRYNSLTDPQRLVLFQIIEQHRERIAPQLDYSDGLPDEPFVSDEEIERMKKILFSKSS